MWITLRVNVIMKGSDEVADCVRRYWKLVREYEKPWELFNLSNDRSELTNLSEQYPERAQQMQQMWEAWATEHQVEFPERFNMYRYLEKQKQQQENKTAK